MSIPQEAIEAAAIIVSGDTEKWFYEYPTSDSDRAGYLRTAHKALAAAMPALEQQIREYIAREIEAKAPLAYYPHESGYEKYQGMKYAAQIARGKDQP